VQSEKEALVSTAQLRMAEPCSAEPRSAMQSRVLHSKGRPFGAAQCLFPWHGDRGPSFDSTGRHFFALPRFALHRYATPSNASRRDALQGFRLRCAPRSEVMRRYAKHSSVLPRTATSRIPRPFVFPNTMTFSPLLRRHQNRRLRMMDAFQWFLLGQTFAYVFPFPVSIPTLFQGRIPAILAWVWLVSAVLRFRIAVSRDRTEPCPQCQE